MPVSPVVTTCQVLSFTAGPAAVQEVIYTGDTAGTIRKSGVDGGCVGADGLATGDTQVVCRRTDSHENPSPRLAEIAALSVTVDVKSIISGASDGTLEAPNTETGARQWRSAYCDESYKLLQGSLKLTGRGCVKATPESGAALKDEIFWVYCAHPWGVTTAGNDGRIQACNLDDGLELNDWVKAA